MVREENQKKFIANRWKTIEAILEEIGDSELTETITQKWRGHVEYNVQHGDLEEASYAASSAEDNIKVIKRTYFAMTHCPYCDKNVKVRRRLSCNTCRECNKIV